MGESPPCNDSMCCSEVNLQIGFSGFPDAATPKATEMKSTHFFQTSLNVEYVKPKKSPGKQENLNYPCDSNTGVVITSWVKC